MMNGKALSLRSVIIVALIIRLLFFMCCLLNGFDPEIGVSRYSDSVSYIIPAETIVEQGKMLNERGEAETNRTPGYPMFLALCKMLAGNNWFWLTIGIQYLLNILGVFLIYHCCLHLSRSEIAAGIAGMLGALNIHDISFCNYILTDSLAETVGLVMLFFLLRYLRSFRSRDLAVTMLSCALCAFIRPAGLFLPFILTLACLVVLLLERRKQIQTSTDGSSRETSKHGAFGWRMICVQTVLAFCLGCCPIFLWQARNNSEMGYNGFSSNSSTTLYLFNCAELLAVKNGITFEESQALLQSDPEFLQMNQIMLPEYSMSILARRIMKDNFPLLAVLHLRGLALELFYPGLFDILRFSDYFEPLKNGILSIMATPKTLWERALSLISMPFTWSLFVNFLLLLAINLLTIIGVRRTFVSDLPWYQKALLPCLLLYFLLIYTGPIGAGAYSRYRLSFSAFQAILVGIALAHMHWSAKYSDPKKNSVYN